MIDEKIGLLRSFLAHRAFIADGMRRVTTELESRANLHDLSKLQDDEFEGFARINGVARVQKFGSPEYAEAMRRESETIDLHFSRNRHHPEHRTLAAGLYTEPDDYKYFARLPDHEMTFVDVIEMVVDWWAAGKGYGNTKPWMESFNLNIKQKGDRLTSHHLWLAKSVAEFLDRGCVWT